MMPHCPKCKSGPAHLVAQTDYLENLKLQRVRCLSCGFSVQREAPKRIEARGKKRPAHTRHGSGAKRKMAAARQRILAENALPCSVHGCEGRYFNHVSKLKMCPRHSKQYRAWNISKKTTPPPLLEQPDGTFIENPERRSSGRVS
jgi:Zn ribbon nucleic-acid-binding protein